MTLFSYHMGKQISKQAIMLSVVILLSLPGAAMAFYSLTHASTQVHIVSILSSHE